MPNLAVQPAVGNVCCSVLVLAPLTSLSCVNVFSSSSFAQPGALKMMGALPWFLKEKSHPILLLGSFWRKKHYHFPVSPA